MAGCSVDENASHENADASEAGYRTPEVPTPLSLLVNLSLNGLKELKCSAVDE
jgi:hypothetical protein